MPFVWNNKVGSMKTKFEDLNVGDIILYVYMDIEPTDDEEYDEDLPDDKFGIFTAIVLNKYDKNINS